MPFEQLQTLVPPVILLGPETYLGRGTGDSSRGRGSGGGGGGGGGEGEGEGEKSENLAPMIFPRFSF